MGIKPRVSPRTRGANPGYRGGPPGTPSSPGNEAIQGATMMFAQVPLFPEQAATTAERVDALFIFQCVITGGMAVLISLLVFYFAIRYHRRSEDERTPRITGSHALEWFWSITPLFVFLVMFLWGASIF